MMVGLLDQPQLMMFAREVVRTALWLVLIVVIFVPLERLFAVRPQKFFRKALLQDLGFYFISSLVPGLLLSVPLSLVAVGAHAFVPWPVQAAVAAWPLWLRVVAGVVVSEVGFYWGHRLTHKIPVLWRFHAVHHGAEQVYFLTSSRAHPFDNVFTRLCGLVPAYILGVANPLSPTGSLVPTVIILMTVLWGFFIHANFRVRLGPLEWLIATPGFHHWHHTRTDHRDHNYASMLPVMDWLFGTFYLPATWPAAYGTDTPLPNSVLGQLLEPLSPRAPEPAEQPSVTP
jgi:sterol desaturase/sphingolipid hydroxylase (fatty acid hydroxylase superfamily)